MIDGANRKGPYLGLVIPNQFELNPLLQSMHFKPTTIIDFIMSKISIRNHFSEPSHTGQDRISSMRHGDGPEDELGLEKNGDCTRDTGYLNFAKYTTNMSSCSSSDNLLTVWYQPDEVFPVDGAPEEREHAFWIPVDLLYFQISRKLEGLELERCLNSNSCLTEMPKVVTVQRGLSASFFLSNVAYQSLLYDTFEASPADMESASVALICLQQRTTFGLFLGVALHSQISPPHFFLLHQTILSLLFWNSLRNSWKT